MTFSELYVLNSALDGNDIYAIPSFSKKRLSKVETEIVKDVLIQKGYLENYNTVTTIGAGEIGKIKYFKEAKRYIHLLDLTIGCIDEKNGILLKHSKEEGYSFLAINLKESIQVLEELFPQLLEEDKDTSSKNDSLINTRDLLNQYEINAKTSFTIQTKYLTNQEKNTKELFFISNDKRYYYDCKDSLLHERSGEELKKILKERLEVY
ncbi:DUF5081 family protein [Anaerosporobacter sp.]